MGKGDRLAGQSRWEELELALAAVAVSQHRETQELTPRQAEVCELETSLGCLHSLF